MNLFRSEEHGKNQPGYNAEVAGGLLPLQTMMEIFSSAMFRERLNGHYVSGMGELRGAHLENLARITGGDPFWDATPK